MCEFWPEFCVLSCGSGSSAVEAQFEFQQVVLIMSTCLNAVVEKLKRTVAQQVRPASPLALAGPTDIACDFCCGTRRNKATMSCLTCLASYCPAHLEPHYSFPVLKLHQLVSATVPLKEKICAKHNKLMEVYCKTDRSCICYLCTMDDHRHHSTVSAAAERAAEQVTLGEIQSAVKLRFQERQEELNELVQAVKDFETCCQTAVKSNDELFDKLISSIQQKHASMKELIETRQKTAVADTKDLQMQLEEEIAKLSRRDADLEQLSHTADHIHFIQIFQSLSISCESQDLPRGAVVHPKRSIKTVTDCLSDLTYDMKKLLETTWPKISATVSVTDFVLLLVPKTRRDLLRYHCPLTLDPNSVNKCFVISRQSKRVTSGSYEHFHSSHSDRFGGVRQVLCREGLTGRCYWEVSWSGGVWSVAASYKNISRTSSDSEFGKNDKSWSLECSTDGYTFRHNSVTRAVSGPRTSQIGVYLDYKSGTLSFYSISDTMTLLLKVRTVFTQPLYPGLGLKEGGSGCYAEVKKF
ncbi:tripartite motif-containing protein 16-like isoform X2 [Oreochromis aureus]|uniref:B30.2/SPRY domain-containing protein n=1 Tax=Oreochromis aureus TaxID=47969 RepID=A0A668V823_OREAU|nr:tripartite motif-containing protein 16-like isoform X2 [Oreochromis aureus]